MNDIQLFGDLEEILLEEALYAKPKLKFPKESATIDAFLNTPFSDWKKSERPDFVSREDLGLELMRVDDHREVVRGYNPSRAHERKIRNEIRESLGNLELAPHAKLLVNGADDLPTLGDHNYKAWTQRFSAVVEKHAAKAKAYRERADVELLAFLIVDESSGYVEGTRPAPQTTPGMIVPVQQIHYWWRDSRFLDVLRSCGADVVLWHRPYAFHPSFPIPKTRLVAIDLGAESLVAVEYDLLRMTSVEA